MSRQEAIRHLKAARLMLLGKDGQPISDLYDALTIAIEALDVSIDEMSNLPIDYSNLANIYWTNETINNSEIPNS